MHSKDLFDQVEPLLTFKAASLRLGVPTFKIRRAAKQGLFPSYHLHNGRKLVRLSEIIAAVERTSTSRGA